MNTPDWSKASASRLRHEVALHGESDHQFSQDITAVLDENESLRAKVLELQKQFLKDIHALQATLRDRDERLEQIREYSIQHKQIEFAHSLERRLIETTRQRDEAVKKLAEIKHNIDITESSTGMSGIYGTLQSCIDQFTAALSTAKSELEELRGDKERLDYVESVGRDYGSDKGGSSIRAGKHWNIAKRGHGGTVRETIDAAIAQTRKEQG